MFPQRPHNRSESLELRCASRSHSKGKRQYVRDKGDRPLSIQQFEAAQFLEPAVSRQFPPEGFY